MGNRMTEHTKRKRRNNYQREMKQYQELEEFNKLRSLGFNVSVLRR